MPSPKRLYRLLARAEVVTWTLLIIGMVLKYVTRTTELGVRVGGGIHGFVFLAYCAATLLIGVDGRWSPRTVLAGLGSAVIPYLTVPFESSVDRRGLLADRWRLLSDPPADEPGGPVDRLAAWALRRPLPAGLVALLALVVVFTGLLAAGPPTQWGS